MHVILMGLALDVHSTVGTLLVIAVVAVMAPLVIALLPGPRIPQVVLLLVGGMLIGPQGLDSARRRACRSWPTSGSGSCSCWPATRSTCGCSGGPRAARGVAWLITAALAAGVVGLL